MAGIKWTKKEDNILKKHWKNGKKKIILNKLPKRTWNAIVCRARILKIKRDSSHINVNGTKKK